MVDLRQPSIVAFLLGGFWLMLLNSGRRKHKFQCTGCETVVYSHTKGSTVFLVLFIVVIVLSVLGILSVFMGWDKK